jgi:hypothetical protein
MADDFKYSLSRRSLGEGGSPRPFFCLDSGSNHRKNQATALTNTICPLLLFIFALIIFCFGKK